MDARAVIAELRQGETPSREDLRDFANGLASGDISDAQAGAFAMAVCLNGLGEEGRVALTEAMRDSGEILNWDVPGPVVDKHSTGGVGDCVSLLLAPALASCGVYIPMISGRGLGHTGGTLDKLEAIPGVSTEVGKQEFREIVEDIGFAIVSASADIAPADKRLYAVRDVTATVESVDLITASILSKKLASGLEALVLDIKCGSGAFMETVEDARALAQSLVNTGNGAGCKTAGLITDMNQPLASSLGNALEIMEIIKALTEPHQTPLQDLTVELGGTLLALSGQADTEAKGQTMIRQSIEGGHAAEGFGKMIVRMGGPKDFIERWRDRLPAARFVIDIPARENGRVIAIDGQALGQAVVHLGGGRLVGGARIDPSVGLSHVIRLGAVVQQGDVLARVHAANEVDARIAVKSVTDAIQIGNATPEQRPLVIERVT
ncbi:MULTISPECIES: thymidine phosphorylase [Halocynthiibacter]|uniref:Thymidine phosphorylase n=1 Tax=Halocynthiibacter halioticoli TaxID=2986804 RepID=A0AAE3J230_9RHOB|nr:MULTISPECIES: thymidine phosphorylase [Halocynthiibacter]MCV6825203.1 thymidine phosphorylase [Halocynthiibacter halioticoli]MCW4058204.1 thymidine phosphorylase [Halocynthiibacter sp. SDUM655004]